MPYFIPVNAIAQMGSQSGFSPAVLLDVQLADGTQLFLSDEAGTYVSRLTGTPQVYKPWVADVGQFHFTRTMRTDSGQITLQNVSGNTIERDVSGLLRDHEFEGAFCILRKYQVASEQTVFEFWGTLSAPTPDEDKAIFTIVQLLDASNVDAPNQEFSENCPLLFASEECGSTALIPCQHTFPTCTAQERFRGLGMPPPQDLQAPLRGGSLGFGDGGGPFDPGYHGPIRPAVL